MRGLVAEVLVGHDQAVKAGDPLVRIDPEEFDARVASAAADLQNAQASVDSARAAFTALAAEEQLDASNIHAAETSIRSADAQSARAQAALDLARQDQAHTLIRAPIDGVVGDRQVEPGDYVQPGTRLLTIVPMRALYVTANFKETQTARMTVGQPATIKVDALPGVALKGEVDSFAPGSGSQFALLPFEPGTGNFTKIVQRVPVRIRFDSGQPGLARLRPGLSTTVKVRLGRDLTPPPRPPRR